MKSLKEVMLGLVVRILDDAALEYPSISKGVELDRSRLTSLTATHGEHLFTVMLPTACDWFHQSLAKGCLLPNRPAHFGKRSNADNRPRFLGDLFCMLFEEDGTLKPVSDPGVVFFIRQILLSCKKWRMDCPQEKVDEAFADFVLVDESLPSPWPNTWDDDHPQWVHRHGHPLWGQGDAKQFDLFGNPLHSPFRWERFRQLCGIISSSFGRVDVYGLRPKHGPGVVADRVTVKGNFDHWPEKLGHLFPPDWFSSHDLVDRTKSRREFPSRIAAVPKTQKGPRLIASEPTAHQWIQGGIQRWLTDAISSSCLSAIISLNDQTPSRNFALRASTDGSFATVDLSAASDRLSCRLVEYVFQANFDLLDVLHASRSRTYIMPDGTMGKFKKFAPMGSACTFPVQSIVFSIIALFAVLESRDLPIVDYKDVLPLVRVFGDDIIVPVDSYPMLVSVLTECGLKVNQSKSFSEGFFRESCGMDAYLGVDVTPAYARSGYDSRDPATLASVVECSNNFFKKGLWHAADYLLKTVPEEELFLLPVADVVVGSCTVFSFCKGMSVAKLRANRHLHCDEILILDLESLSKKVSGTGEASLLQYFTESPNPLTFVKWTHGEAKRPLLRKKKRWVPIW